MSASSRRVLVVGAGLAGLAAAERLCASGCDVTLAEARAQVGGKHAAHALAGLAYSAWPGVLPASAASFAEVSAELGGARALGRAPLERIAWLRDAHVHVSSPALGRALRSPLGALRARRLVLLLAWLGGELDPRAPERVTRLDDRSVADFCRVYLGRRVLEERVAPLLATLLGVDAAETSRQLLFALLDADASLALERVPGAAALAAALAERSGRVRLGTRVESVSGDARSARFAGGETFSGDAIVLAVAPADVARLLPDAPSPARLALERLRMRGALVLAAATRSGIAPAASVVTVPAREGGELAGVVDATPASERDRSLLLLVARPDLARRHGHRPDAELAAFLVESGARVVPGLAAGSEAWRLHRLERPAFAVGDYRELARLLAASPLCLAGDWTSAPHVEGELGSGLRAAARVLRHLRV